MKRSSKRLQILLAVTLLLYACGYLTQFIGNYAVWQKNGGMPGGTSPPFPSLSPPDCLKGILWFPYNLYCIAGCAATVAAIFLYRKLFSQDALTDSERNFDFSAKGTYGTSGWMQPREIPAVLDMVSDLSQHTGTVLGMLDGKFLCIPEKTRMNGNLAVYGASGSMKTRSFCMNRILQSAVRGESLIICDPKSELYEKSSEYMRDLGYTVRVFNLVSPENSDSWNCLKEIEGQELMAQLFVDVIIKNTNGTGKSDRFWDSGEMNLLKALVLYVDLTYPPEQRTIGEVYNLITQCSESQLDSLFDVLPLTHPAKAPYSLYQRASDSVRSGVISGLGSRLQVFQSDLIKKITAYDEISLELPGQQPCAYYLVTSDQDSTFDFLASLFLSFAFIKLVRYADANCPGGRLPVPVHVLGEELTACGTISELSRRINYYLKENPGAWLVYETGYKKLFGFTGTGDVQDTLLAGLLCALCFSGLFAMERKGGMDEILATTSLGRKHTVKAKLRQSTAVAAVISFGTVLPHLWQVLRDYGLPSLLGPAMSISDLQAVPKFITLSDLLIFWLICRFAACLCMSRITLWLGQKLGNLLTALFISAVAYCLPALLSLSGMKNGIEWLGFYPLFHAAALWQNQGYNANGESYNAMWIPIFLVCAAFFLAWAIGQALIDDYDMIGVPDEVL